MDDIAKMHYCSEHECWYEDECLACYYEDRIVDLLAKKHKIENKLQTMYVTIGFLVVALAIMIIRGL